MIPRVCDAAALPGQSNQCGQDPYIVLPDRSECVDQQTLKMQVGAGGRLVGGGDRVKSAIIVGFVCCFLSSTRTGPRC